MHPFSAAPHGDWRHDSLGRTFERQLGIARQLVSELREIGESRGVSTSGEVRTGGDPESAIADLARSQSIDLVVLGADVRPGSDRLFFGPRVERMLALAPCPVIVVNV